MRLLDSVLTTMGLSQPFRRFLGELLMLLVIAYSTGNWTGIPRETGHPFQAKLDRDSTGNWTPEVAKRRAG